MGLGVTQYAYFLLSIHSKQLLLVTFCHMPIGIEDRLRTHNHTDGGPSRERTDRCGSSNRY